MICSRVLLTAERRAYPPPPSAPRRRRVSVIGRRETVFIWRNIKMWGAVWHLVIVISWSCQPVLSFVSWRARPILPGMYVMRANLVRRRRDLSPDTTLSKKKCEKKRNTINHGNKHVIIDLLTNKTPASMFETKSADFSHYEHYN